MSDEPLALDDYEAVNLLWLLRVAQRVGLDTGDWCHQLIFKLEERGHGTISGPNFGPLNTEELIKRLKGTK